MAKTAGAAGSAGSRSAVLATVAALLLIGAALLSFILTAGLALNRSAASAEAALIDTALTDAVDRTLMEQKGLAFWDDGARHVRAPELDLAWLDREFGAYLTEGYGHDELFLLDPLDRPIYGYGQGTRLPPGEFAGLRRAIAPMLREIRTGAPRSFVRRDSGFAISQLRYSTLHVVRTARWAGNLVSTTNGPAIVAAMTMIDPTAPDDPRRAVVMVSLVRVDNRLLAAVGRSINLPDLRLRAEIAAGREALVTDDGATAGALTWTGRRPGTLLLTRVLPILALLIGAALLSALVIVRRLAAAHARLTAQEAQARVLAMHDPLSGLCNRRAFMEALTARLAARAADPSLPAVSIAYVDVDRFKDVNDAIGHAAGDSLVQQIGPRIARVLGPHDLLARLGGDEFAVIASLGDARGADDLGRALMSAFAEPFPIGALPLTVTASIGIATAQLNETDHNRPLGEADISLYRAKDAGRGRYVIFEEAMAAEVRERHEIERELRAAIGTSAISMHYQPILSVRSNAVVGVEALLRWTHPTLGAMNPARFIPIAEQSGLMAELGDDIIARVLKDSAGLANVDVAINLSPLQLRDRGFPASLEARTRAHRIDPRRIVLEITETALIDAGGAVDDILLELRARGFRLALDDFGTGFSSLSHLQRFEFDKIKIDRSFVSSGSVERQRPIIQAIVTIGRGFDMEIVAEGIETAAEFAWVRSLGCHAVQGYWLSKPLPIREAKNFLKKRAAELARLEPAPLEFEEDTPAVAA